MGCSLITMPSRAICVELPGPPKEPKIMAQYLKIETIGSKGSAVLAIFGGPGSLWIPTAVSSSTVIISTVIRYATLHIRALTFHCR